MTITAPHILRIQRTDAIHEYVLLHISSSGGSPLDLKLVATEQEHLYHCTTRESSVKSLRDERYAGSLEQFKAILSSILLRPAPTSNVSDVGSIEITATIDEDTLTINLRQNTSGIKSGLASIDCVQDDEREAVSFPEWVGIAVTASDDARQECRALQTALSASQEQTSRLTAQLDELVQAKKAHENDLLRKFAALLNTKKLKIRDQQRLLAGAKIDPAARQAIGGSRWAEDGADDELGASSRRTLALKSEARSARPLRAGKRKANNHDGDQDMESPEMPETETEDDSFDGVERETPPRSEDEGVATNDAFEAPRSPPRDPGRTRIRKELAEKSQTDGLVNSHKNRNSTADKIPPARTLPFQKTNDPALAHAVADESTDDDDDEI